MHYLTNEHKTYIRKETESMTFSLNKNFVSLHLKSVIILLQLKKDAAEIGMVTKGLQIIRGMNLILYEKRQK